MEYRGVTTWGCENISAINGMIYVVNNVAMSYVDREKVNCINVCSELAKVLILYINTCRDTRWFGTSELQHRF